MDDLKKLANHHNKNVLNELVPFQYFRHTSVLLNETVHPLTLAASQLV